MVIQPEESRIRPLDFEDDTFEDNTFERCNKLYKQFIMARDKADLNPNDKESNDELLMDLMDPLWEKLTKEERSRLGEE